MLQARKQFDQGGSMRTVLILIFILITTNACSSKKIKNEVKDEVAKEPVARDNNDYYRKEFAVLEKTEGLTSEQKNKLSSLLIKNREQNLAIDQEIMKTKAVLFKTLLDEKSSQAKINVLENQLLKLNRKKVRQSLSSFREAKNIVGKGDVALDRTLNLIDSNTKEIHEF